MKLNNMWMAGALLLAGAGLSVTQIAAAGGGHGHGRGGDKGMLKQADKNADGQITVAEVSAFQLEQSTAIDADKNGVITGVELEAHQEALRAQRRDARLARMDANKDGRVSVEEFAATRSERVARMDKNGDGILDASDRKHRGGKHGHGQR